VVCPPLFASCEGTAQQGTEATEGDGEQPAQARSHSSDASDAGAPLGSCAALQQTMATLVSDGFGNVDTTCQQDEECAFISTDLDCYSSCESVIASRSGAQATASAVRQQIGPLCTAFDEQRCESPTPVCATGSPVLVCNGTCTQVAALSCGELSPLAAARVSAVVNDAARACLQDSDCALAEARIRCVSSCSNPTSVASSTLADVQLRIAQTEQLYCGAADSLGCTGPVEPACNLPSGTPQATCNAGQCEVGYASTL
jgi:hypothetical protein